MGPLKDLYDPEVEAVTPVTGVPVGYFSKAMCKQMLERHEKKGKKAAMIVTGSGLGCIPAAGTAHYSAAKAFARFIADSGKSSSMSWHISASSSSLRSEMSGMLEMVVSLDCSNRVTRVFSLW